MGPLEGVRIVEMAGIGPGPYAAMLLADLGADVVRIDRKNAGPGLLPGDPRKDLLLRGRRSIALDLKAPEDIALALALIAKADGLIEGFRPGVMERLGLGPDICLARNAKLVYGRMTGWGQEGPLSQAAGHDINYIALSGVLHAVGRRGEPPVPPLNLLGDFGGGSLFLVMGMLAGIISARAGGTGQIVDAAMVDGSANLMTMMYGMAASGLWRAKRGSNLLDGGTPFYDCYETSDGEFMAVGALEPQFFAELVDRLGLADHPDMPKQWDLAKWGVMRTLLTDKFKTKTRQEWADIFDGSDACVAPVLSFEEARDHPHMQARGTFVSVNDVVQPAPAPRFSATPTVTPEGPRLAGVDAQEIARDWDVMADWDACNSASP